MADPRPPKKSESLEIRIPYPTKQAFMAHCRAEGRSASEELRAFIERTGADELMITSQVFDPAARQRSFEIAAQAMA